LTQIEKSRLQDLTDDAVNASYFFHDLGRELKKADINPLDAQSEAISRAFFKVSLNISAFLEKLEDEGLLSGR
jgi:hypothetical protein